MIPDVDIYLPAGVLAGQLHGGQPVQARVLPQQRRLPLRQTRGSSAPENICMTPQKYFCSPLHHLLPVDPDQVLPHLGHHAALQRPLPRGRGGAAAAGRGVPHAAAHRGAVPSYRHRRVQAGRLFTS